MSLATSPPTAPAATAEFRPQPPREINPHLDSIGLSPESRSGVQTQAHPASSVHKSPASNLNSAPHHADSTTRIGAERGSERTKPKSATVSTPSPNSKASYKSKRVFKVIIIGDAGVGKTCLSFRFCNGRFPVQTEATIGVDFRERNLIIDEELIRVQLWDTAGQERYRQCIVAHYYRNVNAVVFVYDSTNPASFKSLAHWIAECKKHSVTSTDDTPHILIGNKCDLAGTSSRVSTSDAQVFADENDMPLFETSALADSEADHVESIFMTLVHKLRHSKAMHVQSADERNTKEQKLLLKAGDLTAGEEGQSGWCC